MKRILCVDDSNVVLTMERMVLSRLGYELLTASDGEEAVRRAAVEKPDLILLDVVMPRMSGLDACKAIRASEGTAHIPIIMVTTRGEEENVETGFANGCTDWVTKPINGDELVEKIRTYLGE